MYLEQRNIPNSDQTDIEKESKSQLFISFYDTVGAVLVALDGSRESDALFCDLTRDLECVNQDYFWVNSEENWWEYSG